MPIRRLDAATGLTVTYRAVNDETGAEVVASTAAVVDMGGLRYSTATSIPAGQSVEWYIGGVYSFTTDPIADNAGITAAKNDAASAAISGTLIHGTDIPGLPAAIASSIPRVTGPGANRVTLSLGVIGAGAEVWISTDDAGTNVIAGVLVASDAGNVTFDLDAGITYFRWAKKPKTNFSNPQAFIAIAD